MWNEPLFFDQNRVGRIYTGGKLFSGFFGDPAEDGFEPEEWIVSRVHAINKVSKGSHEGVSRVQGSGDYLDELLKKYPNELLGKGKNLRVLVKVLDSAIRLPAQAHPDKAFSRKYFHSEYGKTECWIILDTRPGALLFFGFREGVTVEELVGAENTDCFVINRIRLQGGECSLRVADSYAIYIVTEGSATLRGENYARTVKKGDYFLMPASLMGRFTVSGQAEIVECY